MSDDRFDGNGFDGNGFDENDELYGIDPDREDEPRDLGAEGVGDLSPFAGAVPDELDEDDAEFQPLADAVFGQLLERLGEGQPQPRLEPTRRAVELLGDPHRAYPIIHVTGTNGKTSTSRIIESILRAYGLRTGLMTSPHLRRVNERIVIDGRPISNRSLAATWDDIEPYVRLVDVDLQAAGEPRLTYFEALTVLAFAAFADAPVDVAVIEVGLGGEWDSTNVADGQVAVFAPIDLDHTQRLGSTIEAIARTKSGIIKPAARVVSAVQRPEAEAVLRAAAEHNEAPIAIEGEGFAVESSAIAVGGQLISVRGLAETYRDLFLPLFGEHQAHNAALAIAAVESFLGDGTQPLVGDLLAEGLGGATSPGRLQIVGTEPTVIVDAAHNPHGAAALASAISTAFGFSELAIVVGVLADKDAAGILTALAGIASRFIVTQSTDERALPAADLARVATATGVDTVSVPALADAVAAARSWAAEGEGRGVLVTGSITLIGAVLDLAAADGWAVGSAT
ncbi:folylpolyglutamate synthase/dihydrofolate synthase family protein [Galbitalea sp. SE-J8]|uniref:bifunctional folylpolyglutamate synthase/dihydrofolate synthase n=1 Tax=Galbitalea sp. SE-J8 TaxID=3054952 RepID=UPI00259CF529|nr:folylpolyglutamate synthase/dihydrofolate synthase family protein [Galbitalea sp. SE-J8]MDM4761686.1 folylpolyglutamate synthase/dihydrofolate synthase family protein [Galbitalea sp. SE-J8]